MHGFVCDKCSANIPAGARFCPSCSDPVTDADRPSAPTDPAHERVRLVCPKCETQTLHEIDLRANRQSISCPNCNATFESRVTVVKAKRSSGSKRENRRSFTVRVQNFSGSEEMIEFVNAGTGDLELRSKDIAAFSYLNGELRVVQNMKVNQYMTVSKPSCFVATCLYGADSPEVHALRSWRDQRLIASPLGARFVDCYYRISPAFVAMFASSRAAACVGRIVLSPLVWRVKTSRSKRERRRRPASTAA